MPTTLEVRLTTDDPESIALAAECVSRLSAFIQARRDAGDEKPGDASSAVLVLPKSAKALVPGSRRALT